MKDRKNVGMIAIFLIAFSLTSLACSLSTLSLGKGSTSIDITLTQDQVNEMLKHVEVDNNAHDQLLRKIDRVEMNDGSMRIYGTGVSPTGQDVQGSCDVKIGTKDDVLQVEIIGVDMPGISLDDPRIVEANREIASGLLQSVTESHGDVKYKSASIEKGELKMEIEVTIRDL